MKEKTVQQKDVPAVSEESILKLTKEITVKFIEVGRVTPATFEADFKNIYTSIKQTVRKDP